MVHHGYKISQKMLIIYQHWTSKKGIDNPWMNKEKYILRYSFIRKILKYKEYMSSDGKLFIEINVIVGF